jgi:hypothetical protein
VARHLAVPLTASVQTLKLFSVLGPNVWLIGTSAASRPRAINTRPMRRRNYPIRFARIVDDRVG